MNRSRRLGWTAVGQAVAALAAGVVLGLVAGAAARRAEAAELLARQKMSCAEYARAIIGKGDESKFRPGTWGQSVPAALQKLPPGAELCGVDTRHSKGGVAIIRSALFGSDLEKFYSPLFKEVGCAPLTCDVITGKVGAKQTQQTRCQCSGKRQLGIIGTETGAETYQVSLYSY
jgi:hypothetical protein